MFANRMLEGLARDPVVTWGEQRTWAARHANEERATDFGP